MGGLSRRIASGNSSSVFFHVCCMSERPSLLLGHRARRGDEARQRRHVFAVGGLEVRDRLLERERLGGWFDDELQRHVLNFLRYPVLLGRFDCIAAGRVSPDGRGVNPGPCGAALSASIAPALVVMDAPTSTTRPPDTDETWPAAKVMSACASTAATAGDTLPALKLELWPASRGATVDAAAPVAVDNADPVIAFVSVGVKAPCCADTDAPTSATVADSPTAPAEAVTALPVSAAVKPDTGVTVPVAVVTPDPASGTVELGASVPAAGGARH
jgi:hypothetical protein